MRGRHGGPRNSFNCTLYFQRFVMRSPRPRFRSLKSRLSLIVMGVALGLVARWVSGFLGEPPQEPFFSPMPAISESGDETGEPPSAPQ